MLYICTPTHVYMVNTFASSFFSICMCWKSWFHKGVFNFNPTARSHSKSLSLPLSHCLFFTFYTFNFIAQYWEVWIPLSFIYLLICGFFVWEKSLPHCHCPSLLCCTWVLTHIGDVSSPVISITNSVINTYDTVAWFTGCTVQLHHWTHSLQAQALTSCLGTLPQLPISSLKWGYQYCLAPFDGFQRKQVQEA